MDLLICLDVKGACISQQYHQTLKRRTGIFQNTLKWSLSSSLASAVPSKPSQERLASRFLAQQPVALSGAPRPATALSGRAVARFSESKLFEIAMTLLRLEKRTFYRSFRGGDVIMSSRWLYLFQDNSSTLPVHPEVLLHSTDPSKGLAQRHPSVHWCDLWHGEAPLHGWVHGIRFLNSRVLW